MGFNLDLNHGGANGSLGTSGRYDYRSIEYRKWVTEVALAFYQGRHDSFVYNDLESQFRNPDKQQVFTINLTSEIVDECSILYSDPPKYRVLRKNGSVSKKDQELWDEIQKDCGYLSIMDQLDKFTRLLGTVLVKISFVDETTGYPLSDGKKGKPRLTIVWNGSYDVTCSSSPHFMTELLLGMDSNFSGMSASPLTFNSTQGISAGYGTGDAFTHYSHITAPPEEEQEIFWSLEKFASINRTTKEIYETENPYGIIPAVAFWNKEPIDYFFLPVDEPLLYANHAINMRLSDLNHIAKFQSFGVPVMVGAKRSTNLRRGRPVDDYGELGAGSAGSTFLGFKRDRSRTSVLPGFRDGNANANAMGVTIGPDIAISTGEKGDFKFASPKADIKGLSETIMHMADWLRLTHGLKPKFKAAGAKGDSGFSLMMEKIGVIEDNIRRGKFMASLEKELFKKIVVMWNVHHPRRKFSKDVELSIDYVEPNFPVDPATRFVLIGHQQQIIESGDQRAIKEIFKDKTDREVQEIVKQYHNDRIKQLERNLELRKIEMEFKQKYGLDFEIERANEFSGTKTTSRVSFSNTPDDAPKSEDNDAKIPIDNRAVHSKKSSEQPKGTVPKK